MPALVFVGGFLGAGKTTLILRAAELLAQQGSRVAVITNDQDSSLVDSRLTEAHDLRTSEVAGGCFCCRFSNLMTAADSLVEYQPDVIFAEPVGSCVDLSATILHPLKASWRDRFRLAPLTVLVDPGLAAKVYGGRADAGVSFLFRNQVAEADLICVSKVDRYPDHGQLPVPVDFAVSSLTGEGVSEWLGEVLNSSRVVGAHLLDVDYGRYAAAEAALGWLNLNADIELEQPLSPAVIVGPLLETMDGLLSEAGVSIAHLKVFDQALSGYVKASICATGEEPGVVGDLTASPERRHELVINLRAVGDPDLLLAVVRGALAAVAGAVTVRYERCFRPPPPVPEHRARLPGRPTEG
ncbi:MAG TPA: GTP-binding protein [Bryobacteraceae bacterium]